MCRSEPQTPVASTRTIASSGEPISGSGFSVIRTSPGDSKVTARIPGEPSDRSPIGGPTLVEDDQRQGGQPERDPGAGERRDRRLGCLGVSAASASASITSRERTLP